MNTRELLRALRGVTARTVGVYAADRIPKVLSTPTAIIANTDDHTKPGTHWVALYIDSDRFGTYFDSYGLPPASKHHIDRLKRNCNSFCWNTRELQSLDSTCCGQYAVMFLYHMSRGKSLNAFLRLFTHDTRKNDVLVVNYFKRKMKKLVRKKCKRVNSFANENSRGLGYCDQSCVSRC